MTLEVMLDLETLSTRPNSVILSIGAVKFSPTAEIGTLGDPDDEDYKPFHRTVDMRDSLQYPGFHVEGATLQWWLGEHVSNAARLAVMQDSAPLDVILSAFWDWYGWESKPTWGNGAGFDNVILRNAYTIRDGACPFKYHHDRCFRTFKALFPTVEYIKPALAHHALSDAEAQAIHVQKLYRLLIQH